MTIDPPDLPDVPVAVCTTHLRFVPCRKGDGCALSESAEDVERVRAYQASKGSWPDQVSPQHAE